MTFRISLRALVAVLLASSCAVANAETFLIRSDPADYEAQIVTTTGLPRVSGGVGNDLRVGFTSGDPAIISSALLYFALPALAAGETIAMATLSVNTVASGGTPLANADLYGLPFDPAPPASPRDPALYFSGPNDTTAGVIKLQEDFLVPDDGAGGTIKLSVDLSSYLNQLYAAGAAPGDFAVLRLSYDIQPVDTTTINRYRFRSGDTAVPEEFKPALEIVTIPEPGMAGLLAIATVPLLGSRRRRSCRPALVERHSDFENGSVIFGAEMNASLSTFLKRGER